MSGKQAVNDQRCPDHGQRRERQSDSRAAKELRQNNANLRSDSSTGVHDQRNLRSARISQRVSEASS
jgi:hypothetical protein